MLVRLQALPLRRIFNWMTFAGVTASSAHKEPSQPPEFATISDRDREQAAEVCFWGLAAFPVL